LCFYGTFIYVRVVGGGREIYRGTERQGETGRAYLRRGHLALCMHAYVCVSVW
jgi:hypothetical protein